MKLNDPKTLSVAEAVKKVLVPESLKLDEGKMKDLHMLVKKGITDPAKLAKELKLPNANDKKVIDALAAIVAGMEETVASSAKDQSHIDAHDIEKHDDPEQEKQSESTEIAEDVTDFRGFKSKDKLVKFTSMAKKLKLKPVGNPIVMKRMGTDYHVQGFSGKVRDIEKAIKVAVEIEKGTIESADVNEKLRPKKPNNKSTIDIDVHNPAQAKSSMAKFGLKPGSVRKAGGASAMTVSGKNKDLLAYLTSNDYDMDPEDIKDLFGNILELHDLSEAKTKLAEYDFEEGNEFTAAAAKAKLAGEDEFEFDGKTYPTEISQDAAEKILGKKEENELDEEALLDEAIIHLLEDESINIEEMSDEEIEEMLEGILGKIGSGIKKVANRLSTSGRAAAASKKADKMDKKAADREKLKKAKERIQIAKKKARMKKNAERAQAQKAAEKKAAARARLAKRDEGFVIEADAPERVEGEIHEAIKPEDFVKGGDAKATQRDIDKILSKIFINTKLAKQVEDSKAYQAGEKDKGKKKNPYKKDTADFHLYILGTQSAQSS